MGTRLGWRSSLLYTFITAEGWGALHSPGRARRVPSEGWPTTPHAPPPPAHDTRRGPHLFTWHTKCPCWMMHREHVFEVTWSSGGWSPRRLSSTAAAQMDWNCRVVAVREGPNCTNMRGVFAVAFDVAVATPSNNMAKHRRARHATCSRSPGGVRVGAVPLLDDASVTRLTRRRVRAALTHACLP